MSETYPAGGGSATLDRQAQEQLVEPGDHERYSHYAPKAKIMEAMIKEIYETMPEGPQE
jgi:hypothetical protein